VAILTSIKGKGLFCSVKLFDWYFSIQLSNKDDYLKTEELVIINNPLVHAFGMSMTMRLHQFQFTLNVRNLSRGHQRIIERSKDKEFKSRSGKIPVFDKAGKMLYSHIEGLAKLVPPSPHHYHHTNKQIIIPAEYSQETYYVKSFKENLLIPLQKVNFIYNLIY
jgi:hypothetical protein